MKKLTAGIFTVMLGLVAVNAANAAIPSTNYVDKKIGDVEPAYQAADTALGGRIDGVESAYKAADTTTLNSAKAYTDELKNGQVETNKQNIASMDSFVAPAVAMTVGETNPTTVTGAINALDARITSATSGLATDGKMTELSKRVGVTETDISGLEGRMSTAEGSITTLTGTGEGSVAKAEADAIAYTDQLANGQVKTNKEAIAANAKAIADNATATTDALALKANISDLGDLAAKDLVATSDLDSTLQAAVAQVATNKSGIESLNTEVDTKASKAGYTAGQVVVTDATGAITTAAEISNTQVAGLGGLATKTTIADADVADGAAIAQSKIAGLTTSLSDLQNTKVTIPTATGADGNYVLTATVVDNQATYKWESIERDTVKPVSE